jgi:hypothetical protein
MAAPVSTARSDGDTGDTTAGLPSQRTGIEITNDCPFSGGSLVA